MEKGPTRGLKVPKIEGSWQQKESKILESIDKKLEVARKLKRVIENAKSEKSDKAKTEIAITQLQKQITQQMTPEMRVSRERILKIEKEAQILAGEIEVFEREQLVYDWEKMVKFYEGEGMEKISKINKLINLAKKYREESSEMEFFMTALDLLGHVKLALVKVEEYRQNPELVWKDLAQARKLDYEELKSKLKISEIIFTPISANLVLEKGATFEPLYKDYYDKGEHEQLGLHPKNCFVNIVSGDQDDEGIQETISHEEEHVLGEALDRHLSGVPPIETFKMAVNTKDESTKKFVMESFERGKYTASYLLDSSHDEILTALAESPKLLEYLKRTQERLPEEILLGAIFADKEHPKKIPEKDGGHLLNLLSTAGLQMGSILDSLKKGEDSNDDRFREVCEKLRKQYIDAIFRSGENLGYAYSLANKLGKKAQTDVMLLTYLLKPSQYHHIPEIIKRKY